jgi:hypothetical protein
MLKPRFSIIILKIKNIQKRRFIVFLAFLLGMSLLKPVCAQEFKIGLTTTLLGDNDVLRKSLEGAAGYYGDGFYTIGITSQIPLSARLDFETGIEYGKHTIIIHPNFMPGSNYTPYKSNFGLVNIPITLKVNFLKYLFINGGLLIDIDSSISSPIDTQTGIGAILGIGVKYDFKFGGTLFVNPYSKCHSLLPFSPGKYHQRLLESGVRVGILYNFSK